MNTDKKDYLNNTKKSFFDKLYKTVLGKSSIDDDLLEELEEVLISSDIGVQTTLSIIEELVEKVKKEKYTNTSEIKNHLYEVVLALLEKSKNNPTVGFEKNINNSNKYNPTVILVIGVNGVGKTTTIAKLANRYKKIGKSLVLGAADTFRAAAVEQLSIWAERLDIPIVKQKLGADPASVTFDTIQSGTSKNKDVILIDTAGRLHNKLNLMNELEKIKKNISKFTESSLEVWLVIDGSTGQNTFEQVKLFNERTNITGLIVTKLDGTAKGGSLIGVSNLFDIPIRYIGLGEGIEDIKPFNVEEYLNDFFDKKDEN